MKDTIYVLAERDTPVRSMGAHWLMNYLHYEQSVYFSAEEAEAGRQAGDAYDEPGKTRVVGVELRSFLPPKKKRSDGVVYICRRCGHRLSRRDVSPGYKFYCPHCDEDMYGIEAVEIVMSTKEKKNKRRSAVRTKSKWKVVDEVEN